MTSGNAPKEDGTDRVDEGESGVVREENGGLV